jgi:hypothetical protein
MRRIELEEIGKVEFVEELAEVYKVVSKLAYEYECEEREYRALYNLAELDYESDEWCTYDNILCELNECELSLEYIIEYMTYYDYYN